MGSPGPRRGAIDTLIAAALFGVSTPAASTLVDDVPVLVLAGLLYLGAAVAVLPAVVRSPPSRAAWRRDRRPTLVAVVAGGALGPALLIAGLARTDAATAAILLNLELVTTVVLAGAFFREQLGTRVVAGAVLVTFAGVVAAWSPGAGLDTGALLVAAACAFWGLDNVVTAGIEQLSPEAVVLCKGVVAGGANVALGMGLRGAPGLDAGTVATALAIGALGYGVSITRWVKGARRLGAARAQVIFATAPFLGAVTAWSVLGDALTMRSAVAFALAALGVAVSLDSAHTHGHVHASLEHRHAHDHVDDHHLHDSADGSHEHQHRHPRIRHAHPHVPDLHHRHDHPTERP